MAPAEESALGGCVAHLRRLVAFAVVSLLASLALPQVPGASLPAAAETPPDPVREEPPPQLPLDPVSAIPPNLTAANPPLPEGEPPTDLPPAGTSDSAKWWVDPDGTRRIEITPNRSHFQGADGTWRDVDRRLRQREDGTWVVVSDETTPVLAREAGASLISLPTTHGPIVVSHPDASPVNAVRGDNDWTLVYPDALSGGRDIVQEMTLDGVKESVVVPDASAPSSYTVVYALPIGASAVEARNGVHFFKDDARFAALFTGPAFDATGPSSEVPAKVELVSQVGPLAIVDVSVDPAWFNDPARVFPVTIDPSFTKTTWVLDAGADTYYNSDNCWTTTPEDVNESGEYYYQQYLRVGQPNVYTERCGDPYNGTYAGNSPYFESSRTRSFLRWSLSAITNSGRTAVIDSAEARLRVYRAWFDVAPGQVHHAATVNTGFDDTTVWANQPRWDGAAPGATPTYLQGNAAVGGAETDVIWSVRDAVQRWVSGMTNYGLGIYAGPSLSDNLNTSTVDESDNPNTWDEYDENLMREYYSGNNGGGYAVWPKLSVTYRLAPAAPGNVSVSPGNRSATVFWQTPDDGGSAIDRYQ